jgi:serine/threonine-protein kinase
LPARLKFTAWLLLGVALTGGAGYLVAALLFFPAPLLPNEREVARVIGLSAEEARALLEGDGLLVEVTGREPHWSAAAGVVSWQDPPPGVAVPRGATVAVTLSAGPPRVVVPNVRGLDFELARRVLWAAGLAVEGADSVEAAGIESGIAVGTAPEVGDSIVLGRGVVVHLAR